MFMIQLLLHSDVFNVRARWHKKEKLEEKNVDMVMTVVVSKVTVFCMPLCLQVLLFYPS